MIVGYASEIPNQPLSASCSILLPRKAAGLRDDLRLPFHGDGFGVWRQVLRDALTATAVKIESITCCLSHPLAGAGACRGGREEQNTNQDENKVQHVSPLVSSIFVPVQPDGIESQQQEKRSAEEPLVHLSLPPPGPSQARQGEAEAEHSGTGQLVRTVLRASGLPFVRQRGNHAAPPHDQATGTRSSISQVDNQKASASTRPILGLGGTGLRTRKTVMSLACVNPLCRQYTRKNWELSRFVACWGYSMSL